MKRILCVASSLALAATLATAQQRKAPAAAAPQAQRSALEEGVRLVVEEGAFEDGVKVLEKALSALPDDVAHSRDRGRALLYMAIAYLGMSEEASAKARFVDALHSDKDLNLNPREFSPRVLALFEQAKAEMSGRRAPGGARADVFFLAVKNGDFAAVTQMLKDNPSLVHEKDAEFGATPLHWAALRGQDVVGGLLIAQGADPLAKNRDGETPLQVAQRAAASPDPTRRQRGEAMVRLLRSQDTPIFTAIKAGDVTAVRDLLDKDPSLIVRRDAEFGATPLHWAALKGYESIVGLLMARGADANAVNSAGETPLKVAERANRPDIVLLLRPSGVNLSEAVKAGDVASVRTILDKDPSLVNAPDAAFGATPLHWAALKGHTDMASYLLSVGADVNAKNAKGETPIDVARRAGRSSIVALLTSGAGASPKAPARTPAPAPPAAPPAAPAVTAPAGEPDIFTATRAGDVVTVRKILERNPSLLNQPDPQYGATPLHWAAAKGNVDLVSFLVAAGADGNARNKAGETPLQVAQRASRADVIAVLSGLGETTK